MEKETIFKETTRLIYSSLNSNFHFENLDIPTRVWIKRMCDVVDDRMNKLEAKLKDKE